MKQKVCKQCGNICYDKYLLQDGRILDLCTGCAEGQDTVFEIEQDVFSSDHLTYRKEFNGEYTVLGIDFGRPLVVVKDLGNGFKILRRAGHQTWGGIGSSYYTGTRYKLVHIGSPDRDGFRSIEFGPITFYYDCEPGTKWRDAIKALERIYEDGCA